MPFGLQSKHSLKEKLRKLQYFEDVRSYYLPTFIHFSHRPSIRSLPGTEKLVCHVTPQSVHCIRSFGKLNSKVSENNLCSRSSCRICLYSAERTELVFDSWSVVLTQLSLSLSFSGSAYVHHVLVEYVVSLPSYMLFGFCYFIYIILKPNLHCITFREQYRTVSFHSS